MLHVLLGLFYSIFALGILITVHELGHFLMARRYNVMIERFSIGFGKILWRKSDLSGTEYVISAIPLGGYVKMLDQRLIDLNIYSMDRCFNNKPVLQRATIIASGPILNLLFSIFIYWIVLMIGVTGYRPVIADIIPNSIFAKAKISPGMEVKYIDGIETPDWESVRETLILKLGEKKICIGVAPFGSSNIEKKILYISDLSDNKIDPILSMGIIPIGQNIEPVIATVKFGSSAMKAGLKVGDKIVKVDGNKIENWHMFMKKVIENPGKKLKIIVERQGLIRNITLIPDSKYLNKDDVVGFVGIIPTVLPEQYKIVHKFNPLVAFIKATEKTAKLIRLTIFIFVKFFTGNIQLTHLSGPISIAHGAKLSAENGLIYYLIFISLISINLGIINLFPLPILDGGHLLFLLIEKLKGSPVSERMQTLSYSISSIFLILLLILSIFNDISRIF